MTSADQRDEQPGTTGRGISDDQLPEDLQPGEDNPLAVGLDPDDPDTPDPEELDVLGGKHAEQAGGQDSEQDSEQDAEQDAEQDSDA
jgi:hypothetical protein